MTSFAPCLALATRIRMTPAAAAKAIELDTGRTKPM
jgi:hypothetical protein